VCFSTQHGQVFVDTINPAKSDEVYFHSITSENATVGDLNVQTLTVSHPEGLIVDIPGTLGFGGSSHDIIGELGVTLGSTSAHSLTFTSADTFSSFSQVFGINADNAYIRSTDDMTFQSTRGVYFRSDFFNLDGLFGTIVKSSEENVEISSGVEISSHSEKISLEANEQLFVRSQSGSVEIECSQQVQAVADSIFLQGLLGAQVVADGNIIVYAEDLFQGYAATSSISSLTTILLTSPQNVDFTAADTLLFRSQSTATLSASSELYISANGDTGSSVTVISSADISVDVDDSASFSAFSIHFDSVQQALVSSTLTVDTNEKFAVGSDATKSVYIDSTNNNVEFSLSDGADGELGVDAFLTKFSTTSTASVSSDGDIKVVATNIKSQANEIDFTADVFTAYSLTANGRLIYNGVTGTDLTAGENANVAARDEVVIGITAVYLLADDLKADFEQDFSASADDEISFTSNNTPGSGMTVNGRDITYDAQGNFTINGGDISVSTVVGDIYVSATNDQTYKTNDASFSSNRGDIEVNALQTVLFSSTLLTSFAAADDLSIIAYGDVFTVQSAVDLIFQLSPGSDGVDGLSSFVVGLDFDFTAPSFYFAGADLLFSTGYNMGIVSSADSFLTAPEIKFKTFSDEPAGGIYLTASNTISFTAVGDDITFDSSAGLTLSAVNWNWVTNSFSFVSSQDITFGSTGNLLFDSTNTTVHSDGLVSFSSVGDSHLNSFGDLAFKAKGDITTYTRDLTVTALKNIDYVGGSIDFDTLLTVFVNARGDFNVTATNPGASINLDSIHSGTTFEADNWYFTTQNLNLNTSNSYVNNATHNIAINSNDLTLSAREFDLNAGTFDLQAGSIEFGTDPFLGTYTASSAQLTLTAGEEVAFTSEGDITWNVLGGNVTVTTHDLYLQASNSEGFYSNRDINFLAVRGDNDIEVLSNGGTELHARNGDITINSDNDMLWQAQRALIFRTNVQGIFLFAEDGNFLVDSAASILYEASDAVDLHAYNTDGTASASFIAEEGMLLQSDRNGVYFKAEGLVPNSNDGIFIESTALHGDVIFTTNDGEIIMNCPGPITYDSDAKLNMVSAYDSTYTSLYDMSFSALNGGFNFAAKTGVTITAGAAGNPANLNILQPKSFYSVATSQINIHSLGPLTGNAIEIVADYGSIQFVTSDASDIYLYATNDQTFQGGKDFKIESNEDIQATTPGGPIIFQAETNGRFVTEGGPIQLTTQTGQPGGNINLYAISKNITFSSGNSIFYTAKQVFDLTAETDITIDSADGFFEVAADSSTSVIEANAAGYIKIASTGSRLTPYDGVYLEAANNVEIGTIATDTISFNAVNYFIIGDLSRPIVTINAGGSSSQNGVTVTSDGQILAVSENVIHFEINGELIYNGATSITSESYGPSNIVSTGTGGLGEDITLSANQGTIRLEANYFDMEAPSGIKATTAGILHINQFGDTRNNRILMNAPLVSFIDQGNMLWITDHVDAVLTNDYSLTTKGAGSIVGENGSKSNLVLRANNLFTITSGDLLSFTSKRTYGEIDFTTSGAGSTITLQTDLQSSIEVSSYDSISIYGLTDSFTAGDKISFEAQDAIPNDNAPNGDISFYTTGSINATSQSDVTFGTVENVNIQTTSFNDGVGFPIRFTATDELNIDAVLDINIRNNYNEGGEIEFQALSDISIENSQANGKEISFYADGEMSFNVARDYTLNIVKGGFAGTVGGDMTFLATGIDSVDDYGLQFITESQGDNLDFRSLFGDVSFTASDSVTITADLNKLDSTTSSLTIVSRQSGDLTAGADLTLSANGNFLSETRAGSTYFEATNEFLVATSSSTSLMQFLTNGVDDNGLFAIKFTSTDDSASVDVSSLLGGITVESSEAIVLQGDYVDISSFKPVTFTTVFGDILVEAQLNVTYFSYEGIDMTSGYESEFISGGTIYVNSDGDVAFYGDDVDIDIRTTGTDARIYMYSSGEMQWGADTYFTARTAEIPGADVQVTTTLAHIDITATTNFNGINLILFSSFGDLTIESTGDDGDIYIDATVLDVLADGDIIFTSSLNLPGSNFFGVKIGVETNMIIQSSVLTYYANSLDFDSLTSFTIQTNGNNIGGSINMVSNGNYAATSSGNIQFITFGEDSDIIIESSLGDIGFYNRDTTNLISYTASLSQTSNMKIPYNNYPGTADYTGLVPQTACRIGEMYYTSAININSVFDIDTSDGNLCMCLSDGLYCVRFKEPPYNFYYL